MTKEERFDAKLEELLDETSGAELLAIPGLYEVVSEHFNNEILESLEDQDASAEEDALDAEARDAP